MSLEECGAADGVKTDAAETSGAVSEDRPAGDICVYVCGRVNTPGVYVLPSGSRIYEVIALAGGLSPDADVTAVNQAESCYDGEMIYVSAIGERTAEGTGESPDDTDGRININSADISELQKLKGIGEKRAEDIISYRERYGKFESPESIMNVPGIKQGTYDKIKDQIRV
ncbi:MAG: ComEA family DNA-binding protein [Lachnospiraceae bacterium]|nr:ComEA family DNA-binding protein [Lachnospiraceae bacterium]